MNRTAHPAVTTASRPNRILMILAAAWIAAALAIGGSFAAPPTDASHSGTTIVGDAQP